jgi:hypothetical protein
VHGNGRHDGKDGYRVWGGSGAGREAPGQLLRGIACSRNAAGRLRYRAGATPNDRLARTGLLALLQTLNADLLSHDGATLTLELVRHHRLGRPRASWCNACTM